MRLIFFALIFGFFSAGSEVDLSQTLTQFSLNLLTEASSDANEDAFLSPLSVALALGMVYAGANGTTADQIRDAFMPAYTNRYHVLSEFLLIAHELGNKNEPGSQLNIANKIFLDEDFGVSEEFLDELKHYFKSEVERVDFLTNSAQIMKTINAWVENRTQGRIKDLLTDLSPESLIVLVNAIYFKEDWKKKFHPFLTKEAEFFRLMVGENGSYEEVGTKVQMMSETEKYPYYENDQLQVLGLPYIDSDHVMYVFLPKWKFGLHTLERSINAEMLSDLVGKTQEIEVNVHLPKFTLEQKYELATILQKMGITNIFTLEADLSKMITTMGRKAVTVSNVVHKTFLTISEEGSEAAAASAIVLEKAAPIEPEPIDFIADHPFLFMIYHQKLKAPLFIGRFTNEHGETIEE